MGEDSCALLADDNHSRPGWEPRFGLETAVPEIQAECKVTVRVRVVKQGRRNRRAVRISARPLSAFSNGFVMLSVLAKHLASPFEASQILREYARYDMAWVIRMD